MLKHLQQIAEQHPQKPAIEEPAGCLTYGALWDAIQKAVPLLRDIRVAAIDLPNGSLWIITHFACLQAGIPQLPVPPFFTAEQRLHALRDAGADALILPAKSGASFIAEALHHSPAAMPDGTAVITYTSGSTGAPKGVCLSLAGMETVAHSLLQMLGGEVAKRHLSVLPLAVLLEQVGGLYATLLAGGTYVIREEPLAEALLRSRASSCILVPELLKHLLQTPHSYPDLIFAAVGGARVDEELLFQAKQRGLPVYQGYGLSESASVVSVNTPRHNKPGTTGRLLPHVSCRIASDGEIILQQPAILGYAGGDVWEGEYPTGDLGQIDAEGYISIRGRKKNLLITAYGRNVSPEWPESLLLAQPEIAQAFVYGDGQAALSALLVPSHEGADIAAAVMRSNAQLPDYARIAQWRCTIPFTAANDLATGNGRLRRDTILYNLTKDQNDGFLRPACA